MNKPNLYETTYAQEDCNVGIVHLGFGAFHRAHQAVYIDDYMHISGDLNWGIAAVNLRGAESDSFARAAKDAGYVLKTMSPEGEIGYRLVRSHVAFKDWSQDAEGTEALLAQDNVQLVTITVTESGYSLTDRGGLNTEDPVIAAEIAGAAPQSVYGFLARGLAKRLATGGAPITIGCCDNIRGNGHMLEENVLAYLKAMGLTELHAWAKDNVAFPNSMVDRITPRASDTLFADVSANWPDNSAAPVHAEVFKQWVLQDNFAGPMPDLAQAGVQIVDDVDPYEEAKIRILNGGHTGLCYFGALAGHKTFDQAMMDDTLRPHFDAFETDNVLPGLDLELPFDRKAYMEEIANRFANPSIADALERICMDGWSKMPIYIRPTLESCLAQGINPEHTLNCIASWVIYARRARDGQLQHTYVDPFWDDLLPLLAPGAENSFATNKQLWTDLPERFEHFAPALVGAIKEMEQQWQI